MIALIPAAGQERDYSGTSRSKLTTSYKWLHRKTFRFVMDSLLYSPYFATTPQKNKGRSLPRKTPWLTTDQKAGGSNPSRRAKTPVESVDFTGVLFYFCTFCGGLFLANPFDPYLDPYGEITG